MKEKVYFYIEDSHGTKRLVESEALTKEFGKIETKLLKEANPKNRFIEMCKPEIIVQEIFGKVVYMTTKDKETIESELVLISASIIGMLVQLTTELIRKTNNNKIKLIYLKNNER